MRKRGFTLIELLVVIAIIAMLLAILMPALSKVKKIAQRVVCGTNLKGLGTAQTVYAHDYEDEWAVQGRGTKQNLNTSLTDLRTQDWNVPTKQWADNQLITIGASLFLLVREADVAPKSFVCPGSEQQAWDEVTGPKTMANPPDIVEVWDFGGPSSIEGYQGPEKCVSYSYHQPYACNGKSSKQSTGSRSKFAAIGSLPASFAVMADRNPCFDDKLTLQGVTGDNYLSTAYFLEKKTWDGSAFQRYEVLCANSQPHDREGQNVLYADGHSSYEDRPDVAVRYDNIYTYHGTTSPQELDRRKGKMVGGANLDCYAMNIQDSILVNDAEIK